MEELRDEDVHLEHVGDVLPLDVSEDVDEPLEVSVRRADPEEVDLLAGDARVPVGGRAEDEVVEDGGVWRDPDPGPDHDSHLELVPVLVTSAKWALDPHFGYDARVNVLHFAFI